MNGREWWKFMEILHRANTVKEVHAAVSRGWQRFEIDVQPLADGTLVVFHDDVGDASMSDLPPHVPTFEEFLRSMPDSIHIMVETKVYTRLPDVDEILGLCGKHPNVSYSFSTFHRPTYEILLDKAIEAWLLLCDKGAYMPQDPRICVDKKLLEDVDLEGHLEVFVYDVSVAELDDFKGKYPRVKGWILDP